MVWLQELNTNVFKSSCETRGYWDHSWLNLSALSTVLLLLGPKTLILLNENLVWQPLSSFLPLLQLFQCIIQCCFIHFKFFSHSRSHDPCGRAAVSQLHSWKRNQICCGMCMTTVAMPLGMGSWYAPELVLMTQKALGKRAFYSTACCSSCVLSVLQAAVVARLLSNRLWVPTGSVCSWGQLPGCRVWALAIFSLSLLLSSHWSSFIAAIYWNLSFAPHWAD